MLSFREGPARRPGMTKGNSYALKIVSPNISSTRKITTKT